MQVALNTLDTVGDGVEAGLGGTAVVAEPASRVFGDAAPIQAGDVRAVAGINEIIIAVGIGQCVVTFGNGRTGAACVVTAGQTALITPDGVGIVVLNPGQDLHRAGAETVREGDAPIAAAAVAIESIARLQQRPVKFLDQHHVHDAGDRVRAVK